MYSPSGCVPVTVNETASTSALTGVSVIVAAIVGAAGALPDGTVSTPPSDATSSGVSAASYAATRVAPEASPSRKLIVAEGFSDVLAFAGKSCPHGRPST